MVEGLVGREEELAALDGFLSEAKSGPVGLVLEGEPGIGKTTLWLEGVRRAGEQGFTVLSSRPAEAEAKLAFAGLADLLAPVGGATLNALPAPQRYALEVALLRVDPRDSPAEPRAVAAGLGSVLVELAQESPLLLAIDDTQWLDAPSATAVQFALRRFERNRVGVLVARRPAIGATRVRLELAEAHVLEVGGLSVAAIHEVLKSRLGRSLPRPLLLRVYELSAGNAFFALELARELERTGARPGDPLPIPKFFPHLLRRRLARLSQVAREALLVAAAAAEPTRGLVSTVLAADPSPALEEAEREDFVVLEGERIRFTHPLYGATIYAAATRERRRRLHGQLGSIVDDVQERARHLALSDEAPSAELAALIDEAAELAVQRGAPAAAAELTDLALARTPADDDERRQDRTLALIDRLILAADSPRARDVARAALPAFTTPARRVRTLLALADLAYWTSTWGSDDEHPTAFARQALAAAEGDGALAARAHIALVVHLESDSDEASRHAEQALALIEDGAIVPVEVHAQALTLSVRCRLFQGDGLDIKSVERAIELERASPPSLISDRSSYKLAQWLKYVDDFAGSRRGLEQALQTALGEGDGFSVVNVLINLVVLECWAGRWARARELGFELVQRFLQLGMDEPAPHVGLVAALTGDVATVRAIAELKPWDGVFEVIRLRPLGLLALSERQVDTAYAHYSRALERLEVGGMREPAVFRVHGDAIESATRSGNLDQASRWTEALVAHADRSAIPWNKAMAARSRALVAAAHGELESAHEAVVCSLREHEELPMPFELARTLLIKGEIERRAKRKSAAKESLERALAIFAELGARLWVERTREEIERLGLRRAAPGGLTSSEQRVAELAASGLTNREVATQLFMSPKTVEANLSRAYRKLGIRSRAELGARLGRVPT